MRLKAALCQMNIRWEDKAWNLEKAHGFMKEAAKQGADILLFPEMSLTGFSMNTEATKELTGEARKELTEELTKEAAEELTKKAAKELTKKAAEELTKEAAEELTKEAAEEFTKELTKKAAKELTKKAAEELTKKAAEELTKKAAEELTKEAAEELTKEAAEEFTKGATKEFTEEAHGETVAEFQRLCTRYGIGAGIGWVKAAGEKAENHYTILDGQGRVLEDFVKLHPFSSAGEDRYFKPGNRIAEFELWGIPSTVFICYDLRFPEVFQAASNRAELMIIPANWPKARSEHWKCLLRARAIENQAYVLGINCTGKIGELSYQGDSCVISPQGEVISAMGSEEGILYQEIEADTKQYRESFPVKDDRRTEFYKSIL